MDKDFAIGMDTTIGTDPLTSGDYQHFPSVIHNNLACKPLLLSSLQFAFHNFPLFCYTICSEQENTNTIILDNMMYCMPSVGQSPHTVLGCCETVITVIQTGNSVSHVRMTPADATTTTADPDTKTRMFVSLSTKFAPLQRVATGVPKMLNPLGKECQ